MNDKDKNIEPENIEETPTEAVKAEEDSTEKEQKNITFILFFRFLIFIIKNKST